VHAARSCNHLTAAVPPSGLMSEEVTVCRRSIWTVVLGTIIIGVPKEAISNSAKIIMSVASLFTMHTSEV
jgi:hypothetical protein